MVECESAALPRTVGTSWLCLPSYVVITVHRSWLVGVMADEIIDWMEKVQKAPPKNRCQHTVGVTAFFHFRT